MIDRPSTVQSVSEHRRPQCDAAAHGDANPRSGAGLRRECLSWLGVALLSGVGAAGCSIVGPPQRTPRTAPHTEESCEPPPSHACEGLQPPAFSALRSGDPLPKAWEPYVLMPGKGITRYELVEGPGATVLRATTDGKAATGLYWRPALLARPLPHAMHWSWLASRLFDAADVSDTWMDDSPGRVVLAFDGELARLGFRDRLFREQVKLFTGVDLPYATLIYVWDPRLPVGSVVPIPQTSRIRYIVVESGARGVGSWQTYRRHVVSDFHQAFGEPPGRLLATGLMTDSDDLGGNFDTLYGDLRFDWTPSAST